METPGKNNECLESDAILSPDAPPFIPGTALATATENKKVKKIRAGPRKRRKKKNDSEFLDFDTSDLLERSSQGSNASSTPGTGRSRRNSSNRERGDKSYVPLYHYGLSPQESGKFADLTNMNLFNMNERESVASEWLTGLMGGDQANQTQGRFRSASTTTSDVTCRSSEWLDMQAEWSLSKQLFGSLSGAADYAGAAGTGTGTGGGVAPSPALLGGGGGCGAATAAAGLGSNSMSSGSCLALDEEKERKRWSDWAIRYNTHPPTSPSASVSPLPCLLPHSLTILITHHSSG
jgi:hypothetical protein